MAAAAAAAAGPSSRGTNLLEYVRTQTHEIQRNPRSVETTRRVSALSRTIEKYLNQVDMRDVRCRFFALDLRNRITLLIDSIEEEGVGALAKKVRGAVGRLVSVQESPEISIKPVKPAEAPHPEFDEWIRTNDLNQLKQLQLHSITREEGGVLFDWALKKWVPDLLFDLICTGNLSTERKNALVTRALDKNAFEEISIPIILYHFRDLPKETQGKIAAWIDRKPFPKDPKEFQSLIGEMMLSEETAGAFNHLLNPDVIRSLPQEVREDLFQWAEDNDDLQLVNFMIEHDLVRDFFNETVTHALDEGEFEKIADLVLPDNLSHLTEKNRQMVIAWTKSRQEKEVPRLKGRRDEREEKFHPSEAIDQLREFINERNWKLVGAFLQSPLVAHLQPNEILELIPMIDRREEGIIAALQLRLHELFEEHPS